MTRRKVRVKTVEIADDNYENGMKAFEFFKESEI